MAQATNYMPSANVSVWFQAEAVVGTEADDAGLKKLQCTGYTIPEASMPLEYSAQRVGQFTNVESQGHHSQGTKLWTFDTTLKGTVDSINLACLSVFEDGDGNNELSSTYIFPTTGYTVATGSGAKTYDIRFVNAGTKAAAVNATPSVTYQCLPSQTTLILSPAPIAPPEPSKANLSSAAVVS